MTESIMFATFGITLLAAIIADQQQSKEAYGAGEQRRWSTFGAMGNNLVEQLKNIDDQMYNVTKKLVGFSKGMKLAAQRGKLKAMNAQRDALIASGLSSSDPSVVNIDQQFRQIVSSILGSSLTNQIEKAVQGLKNRRDELVRAIGQSGLISNWESYGGYYGIDLNAEDYGLLLRSDMFGQIQRKDFFGQIQRRDLFGQLQRTDLFGTDRWTDAWYGAHGYGAHGYGGTPLEKRMSEIEAAITKILKKILGWKAATKGPRLLSLNNQRDKLILSGTPVSDPKVQALENEAVSILQASGMPVPGEDYAQIKTLGAERDALLVQKAALS